MAWYRLTFGQLMRKPAVLLTWYVALLLTFLMGGVTEFAVPPAVLWTYAALPVVFGGGSWLLERRLT